ncbi:winged helix-turn-helix transcriptional regulator [Streptomyces sp. SYSU K21746]
MISRRSYEDGCHAAQALDLVGERWALLVVRELLFSPKRFTDLQGRLPGASTSVLTQRLRELTASDVVTRRKLPPPAGSWVYQLTDWGRELEPVIAALGIWASRSPQRLPELPVTPASLMLAFKAFANPDKVKNLPAPVELQLDEEIFHAAPGNGGLLVTGPTGQHPAARIIVSSANLNAFLHGQRATSESLKRNDIRIEGDHEAAIALLNVVGG